MKAKIKDIYEGSQEYLTIWTDHDGDIHFQLGQIKVAITQDDLKEALRFAQRNPEPPKPYLTDDELLRAVDKATDEMFKHRQIPPMNIPARPNEDYDLLIGELILRYQEKVLNHKP